MSARTVAGGLALVLLIGVAWMEHRHMGEELVEMKRAHERVEADLRRELSEHRRTRDDELGATRQDFSDMRQDVSDMRRSHAAGQEERAQMRSEIVDLHRRLAEGAEGNSGGKRVLQDSTPAAGGDAQCLDPNSVSVAALDMAHSANEELARILPEIDAKANATDLAQVQTRLADVTAAVSTLLGQPVAPDEALACVCAVCAEPAAGTGTAGLCEPWEVTSQSR